MSILASPEYVSAGSRMVWTGQFGSFLFSSGPTDLIAQIGAALNNNFQLTVEKSEHNISTLGLGSGSITLWLRTDQDRGDGETDDGLTDIKNNVDDAFRNGGSFLSGYAATLASSSLSQYTPAPNGDNTAPVTINTGTPLATVPQQEAMKPAATGSWWDSLVGKVEAGSVGFVVGGAVVIGLLVFLAVKSEI